MLDGGCGESWKRSIFPYYPPKDDGRSRCKNEAARQRQPAVWFAISEIPALIISFIGNLVLRQQREREFIRRRDAAGMMPAAIWKRNPKLFRPVGVLIDFKPGVFVLRDDSPRLRPGNGPGGMSDGVKS
jgi:hypothetical protein